MSELRINGERCTNCGLCASVCPAEIIGIKDGDLPQYVQGGAEFCLACGHCEAVCPAGAVTLENPALQETDAISGVADLKPERLSAYLRMRRSVRRYRQEPVDRDLIGRLLDVVRYAPTGHNRQAVRWLVVHDAKEVWRLTGLAVEWMRQEAPSGSVLADRLHMKAKIAAWESGRDSVCRHAPHLAVAYVEEGNQLARTDAVIALSHLDVLAPSFGLGACWAGIFRVAAESYLPLQEALAIPAGYEPVHFLMLGYPDVHYQRPPKRNRAEVVWR